MQWRLLGIEFKESIHVGIIVEVPLRGVSRVIDWLLLLLLWQEQEFRLYPINFLDDIYIYIYKRQVTDD